MTAWPRFVSIIGGIVLLHAAALWALHTGLMQRVHEVVVPIRILAEPVEAPRPAAPPPDAVPHRPATTKAVEARSPPRIGSPALQPARSAAAAADGTREAAQATAAPAPPGTPAPAATSQPSNSALSSPPSAAPAPAPLEFPSSDADYLQNPKTPYPPISRRLGEQGTVLVNVYIGVDGSAHKAEIRKSSGFDRLDQAALAMVLKWRYVPGKRAGTPEAMWFTVPIPFVLD